MRQRFGQQQNLGCNADYAGCKSQPADVSNFIKRFPFRSLTNVRKDLPQPNVDNNIRDEYAWFLRVLISV